MLTDQTESFWLEQRYDMKFLLAEKYKPWEIYRMCDVYREACFSKKDLYRWTRDGVATSS